MITQSIATRGKFAGGTLGIGVFGKFIGILVPPYKEILRLTSIIYRQSTALASAIARTLNLTSEVG
jgi:hypothetical protein